MGDQSPIQISFYGLCHRTSWIPLFAMLGSLEFKPYAYCPLPTSEWCGKIGVVGSTVTCQLIFFAVEQIDERKLYGKIVQNLVLRSGIKETVGRVRAMSYLERGLREVTISLQLLRGEEICLDTVIHIPQDIACW